MIFKSNSFAKNVMTTCINPINKIRVTRLAPIRAQCTPVSNLYNIKPVKI